MAQGDPAWQTVLFTTMVFAQLAVALEARSEEEFAFQNRPVQESVDGVRGFPDYCSATVGGLRRWRQHIFNTVAMPLRDLAVSVGLA
ncbi:MAG: cation-translocating P-type ATPase C-terminal domain-containing protein [Desulfomicrobium escambiense]|nr:cation-translocating P-type ATPase C-terminal domain-containing protein [Desulfomicrobium escambiense]